MVRAHLSQRRCSGYKVGLISRLSRELLLHPPVQKLARFLMAEPGDHGIKRFHEVGAAPKAIANMESQGNTKSKGTLILFISFLNPVNPV